MANGPYGPQTGGAASPGPYNQRGGKKVGPYNAPQGDRVTRMRATLRKNGYDVDQTGPMTHRMLRAWHAYRVGIHPHVWNENNSKSRGDVPRGVAKGVSNFAKEVTSALSGGSGKTSGLKDLSKKAVNKATQKVKVHAAAQKLGGNVAKPTGHPVPGLPKLNLSGAGNPSVQKLIPASMADQLAGIQFDPQIREALLQQGYGKRDEAQRQRDLSSWYGQVRGSQATAGQRDTAAIDSARSSIGNELKGVLESLGGSRGAGVVGAQGLADLTALAGQGASQEQYNADLAPILAQEESGQHARQAAIASQGQSKLANQVIDLRGQRGQAKAKALMDILQANNAARQGNFGNRLAVQNAQLAGASLGLNTANVSSEIAARNAGVKQNALALKLKAADAKAKRAGGQPGWLALQPGARIAAIDNALSPYIDPQTGGLIAGANPNDIYNQARAQLRAAGFTSAVRAGRTGKGINPRARDAILLGVHSRVKQLIARRSQLGATPTLPTS